jgi:hypothetical protein
VNLDALKRSLVALIAEAFPRIEYLGIYAYRVTAQSGALMDAVPDTSNDASGVAATLPDVFAIAMRPGIDGAVASWPSGASIAVAFLNGDPARAFVAYGDPDSVPTLLTLDALAGVTIGHGLPLAIARQTDPVVAGPFAGTITLGSTLNKAG